MLGILLCTVLVSDVGFCEKNEKIGSGLGSVVVHLVLGILYGDGADLEDLAWVQGFLVF